MSVEMKGRSLDVQLEVVSSMTTAPGPPPPACDLLSSVELESGH